jgi:chromosome transmission fidelity protein 1
MQDVGIGCGLQALCINDSVQRLATATRINEKCLDLQSSKGRKKVVTEEQGTTKASSKSQSGCPFRKVNMTSQRQLKVSSKQHGSSKGSVQK